VSATARATGIARRTIDRGIAELCACGNGIGTATAVLGAGASRQGQIFILATVTRGYGSTFVVRPPYARVAA
jgi:hypothetical protein